MRVIATERILSPPLHQVVMPAVSAMITGSISFAASLTIIVMILRSNLKLTTVYRRLIFGVSAFDLIQSLSQAMSSLPMPAGWTWAAVGNNITCDLQGFTTLVGVNGSVLYSISLSVYFLFAIQFEVEERKLKKRIEPFLHAIPVSYTLFTGVYLYIKDYYNPAGTVCWIAPSQELLDENQSGMLELIDGYVMATLPIVLTIFVNVLILCLLWFKEYNLSVGNQRQRLQRELEQQQRQQERHQENISNNSTLTPPLSSRSPTSSGLLVAHLSRPSKASQRRRKDIVKRATAFIVGFLLSHAFSFTLRIWQFANDGSAPFACELLARTFFPLQGFFNLLIYTYPHALVYHRNRNCSWFKAFTAVIKSGGDSDRYTAMRVSARGRRRRRGGHMMRNEPVVTDLNNFNFQGDHQVRQVDNHGDSYFVGRESDMNNIVSP